jgi:hypothetical protein
MVQGPGLSRQQLRIRTSENRKCATRPPEIEIVDLSHLTGTQFYLLTPPHLTIHHLQLERLNLLLEPIDGLDELLWEVVALKCCLARGPHILEPLGKLILDRQAKHVLHWVAFPSPTSFARFLMFCHSALVQVRFTFPDAAETPMVTQNGNYTIRVIIVVGPLRHCRVLYSQSFILQALEGTESLGAELVSEAFLTRSPARLRLSWTTRTLIDLSEIFSCGLSRFLCIMYANFYTNRSCSSSCSTDPVSLMRPLTHSARTAAQKSHSHPIALPTPYGEPMRSLSMMVNA